jgi:large subunit ribosomal protein L29
MSTAALTSKDLREKSLEDLRELEKTKGKELFDVRFKNFTNRLDDTSLINKGKRELARIKTILLQRTTGVGAVAADGEAAPKPGKAKAAKASKPAKAPKAEAKAAAPKAKAEKAEKPAAEKTEKKATKSKKSEAK